MTELTEQAKQARHDLLVMELTDIVRSQESGLMTDEQAYREAIALAVKVIHKLACV